MATVTVQFFGELNDFLPHNQRNQKIVFSLSQKTAIKHILESLGVPHPEIGRVVIAHHETGLAGHACDGDFIEVYPHQPSPQLETDPVPAFVLDNHLGKLAGYMRLLGLDVLYNPAWQDEQLAQVAHQYNRILLTRDRGLLKRKIVHLGYCVRADNPLDQVLEVIGRYQLTVAISPFKRCQRCNGLLEKVEKSAIDDQLQPLTRQYFNEFTRCADCGQIYWKGSHYQRIQELLHPFIPQPSGEQ